MCLACVGACPEGALLDHPQAEQPELRFIETKCVQCGVVRGDLPGGRDHARAAAAARRARRVQPRVLNEAAMFKCIRCGKPLGTEKMIGNMLARLAGHSMFAAPGALDRLKMCADCRVLDMMKTELPTGRAGSARAHDAAAAGSALGTRGME